MKALLLGRFYSPGSKKVRSLSAKPSAEDLAYIFSGWWKKAG